MECDCCQFEFNVDELKEFENGDNLCENCFDFATNTIKKLRESE